MLVAVDGASVTAVDLSGAPGPVSLSPPSGERRGLVEVLLYERPLAELGFVEGAITPSPSGEPGFRLPSARSIFQLRLEDGEDRWSESSSVSPALAAFRSSVPPPSPCYRFHLTQRVIPSGNGVTFVALGNEGVALLGSGGRIFAITTTVVAGVTIVDRPQLDITSVHRAGSGSLYLGARAGAIYSGRLEGTAIAVERIGTSSASPRFIDSGGVGGEDELFIVTRDPLRGTSNFGRLFAGSFTVLHSFPGDHPDAEDYGGVVRLGPRSAIAGRVVSPELVRWSDGTMTREVPGDGREGISAMTWVPSLGVVVGTSVGGLYAHDGARWKALPSSGVSLGVTALAPFEDGFFYGGVNGPFGYYSPRHGICPAGIPLPNSPIAILPLGESWLFAGERFDSFGDPIVADVTVER